MLLPPHDNGNVKYLSNVPHASPLNEYLFSGHCMCFFLDKISFCSVNVLENEQSFSFLGIIIVKKQTEQIRANQILLDLQLSNWTKIWWNKIRQWLIEWLKFPVWVI